MLSARTPVVLGRYVVKVEICSLGRVFFACAVVSCGWDSLAATSKVRWSPDFFMAATTLAPMPSSTSARPVLEGVTSKPDPCRTTVASLADRNWPEALPASIAA